jgi:hypothetical protein
MPEKHSPSLAQRSLSSIVGSMSGSPLELEPSDDPPVVVSSLVPVLPPVELLPSASVVVLASSPVLVPSSGSASLVLAISRPVELSSGSPVLAISGNEDAATVVEVDSSSASGPVMTIVQADVVRAARVRAARVARFMAWRLRRPSGQVDTETTSSKGRATDAVAASAANAADAFHRGPSGRDR